MPAFRRILERLDEFLAGVPNKDITAEHFATLEPEVQHTLLTHASDNPTPLFVQDDSVQGTAAEDVPVAEVAVAKPVVEPVVEAAPAPEPAPESVPIPDASLPAPEPAS